jgi:hypothetical protein
VAEAVLAAPEALAPAARVAAMAVAPESVRAAVSRPGRVPDPRVVSRPAPAAARRSRHPEVRAARTPRLRTSRLPPRGRRARLVACPPAPAKSGRLRRHPDTPRPRVSSPSRGGKEARLAFLPRGASRSEAHDPDFSMSRSRSTRGLRPAWPPRRSSRRSRPRPSDRAVSDPGRSSRDLRPRPG